jgi:hypothetical protein
MRTNSLSLLSLLLFLHCSNNNSLPFGKLISVKTVDKKVIINPRYYLNKTDRYVHPGDTVLGTITGRVCWGDNLLCSGPEGDPGKTYGLYYKIGESEKFQFAGKLIDTVSMDSGYIYFFIPDGETINKIDEHYYFDNTGSYVAVVTIKTKR